MAIQGAMNVTTSGSIDGWDIERHLGVVACHLVAGTGFFSDLLAGFSDIFGGRSEAYRQQLASLYDDAIEQLTRLASARGGNWLVGLRVDLDQVSGKGKQMFMITGLATAVVARPRAAHGQPETTPTRVLAHDVAAQLRRMRLIQQHQDSSVPLPEELLARLTEARIIEVAPAVLRSLAAGLRLAPHDANARETLVQRHASFFIAQQQPAAVAALFAGIAQGGEVAAAAVAIVLKGAFGDLSRVLQAIDSDNQALRRTALQTLVAHQPTYVPDDLQTIDRLLDRLTTAFPPQPEAVRKKLLGGDWPHWLCVCGEAVAIKQPDCGKCQRDRFGFAPDEVRPARARNELASLRTSLVTLFGARKSG